MIACGVNYIAPTYGGCLRSRIFRASSLSRRPANFARPQAGVSRFSRIGEKHDLGPVHSRSGVAGAATKNPGAFVTPDHAVGKFVVRFAQRKAFAAQKAQLAGGPD